MDESLLIYNSNNSLINLGFSPEFITIDKKKALLWLDTGLQLLAEKYKNIEFAAGFPSNYSTIVKIYDEDDSCNSKYLSIAKAQEIAKSKGNLFFYYKNSFIISNETQFDKFAQEHLRHHYEWEIRSFMPDRFNFIRNTNTLRVYSKLSSLPSSLLPFVKINGHNIMQADLKCSQFTIFGNLLNYYLNHSGTELIKLFKKKKAKTFVKNLVSILNSFKQDELPYGGLNTINPIEDEYNNNDVYKFIIDTLMHDFYGILKAEFNLPQREHGKEMAFKTLFSKAKPETYFVKQLKRLYPTIIKIINDFKEKFGYNEFSLGLQRLEGEIFIDNIWRKFKSKKINSFTRHDSIVFSISQENNAKNIISSVFKDFDFLYKIKYEEFNFQEGFLRLIDESDYVDFISADLDEVDFYSINNN